MEIRASIVKFLFTRKYVNLFPISGIYISRYRGLQEARVSFSSESKQAYLTTMASQDKGRTYEETISALNGLQSNAATIKHSRKDSNIALRNLKLTKFYLEKIGVQVTDLTNLRAVHVSGTKGKGSTCCFAESIFRSKGLKTGFYSSPHLIAVRERIRLNGQPISEAVFIKYFWEVYSKIFHVKDSEESFPPYFMFLTILSFYTFLKEKVDVAIIEVGIGGEYDCTNILSSPVVTGITSIGLDHVEILGDTLEKIAWQKSGIFKPDVPAFTVPQLPGVLTVFQNRAREKGCELWLCPPLNSFLCDGNLLHLKMQGQVQKTNASLALQLAHCWFQRTNNPVTCKSLKSQAPVTSIKHADSFPVSKEFKRGLENCQWTGRFQIVKQDNITYFLDGAHTPESISLCLEWFLEASQKESDKSNEKVFRALLFNCTGGRKSEFLLSPLTDVPFDVALFTPNLDISGAPKSATSDRTNFMVDPGKEHQQCIVNQNIWSHLQSSRQEEKAAAMTSNGLSVPSFISDHHGNCPTGIFASISDALSWLTLQNNPQKMKDEDYEDFERSVVGLRQNAVHCLVTGSLHLVGGVLAKIQQGYI